MAEGASRKNLERIERAIAYIDEHVLDKPGLEEIASAACLSPYHFHRAFGQVVGEPVAAYVRRRVLARAAWALIYRPEASVTEIALGHGFSAHSDFSRAFKSAYGKTPLEFKARATGAFLGDTALAEAAKGRIGSGGSAIKPCIRSLGDLNLAYIRSFGLSHQRKSSVIEAAFARLYAFLEARSFLGKDTMFLGLTMDPPETLELDRCRYYACASAPKGMEGEGEVGVGTFRTAGDYACAELAGGQTPFFEACGYLAQEWIPRAGLAIDERPFIELFSEGEGSCWKILMPVAKKARFA